MDAVCCSPLSVTAQLFLAEMVYLTLLVTIQLISLIFGWEDVVRSFVHSCLPQLLSQQLK